MTTLVLAVDHVRGCLQNPPDHVLMPRQASRVQHRPPVVSDLLQGPGARLHQDQELHHVHLPGPHGQVQRGPAILHISDLSDTDV